MLQKARFERGKELLEAEFRSLLTRYSKPVPPVLILDAIGGDEDMEVQEDVTLEHLPEAVLQDIICISAWLLEYGRNQGGFSLFLDLKKSLLKHFNQLRGETQQYKHLLEAKTYMKIRTTIP